MMTLLKREMFQGGTLTSASPGANFSRVDGTLVPLAGGPMLAGGIPRSVDPRAKDLGGNIFVNGRFTECDGQMRFVAGGWYFLKSIENNSNRSGAILAPMMYTDPSVQITVSSQTLAFEALYRPNLTWFPFNPKDQWVYLMIALRNSTPPTGSLWDARAYYKLVGGPFTQWASFTGVDLGDWHFQQVHYGVNWNTPSWNGRFGACALYSFAADDFSDIAYPADTLEPAGRYTYYLNPATGNDSNDGLSVSTAWKTPAKLNDASDFCTMLSSPNYASGSTLIIDTSAASLDLTTELAFKTAGLNILPASGQTWIVIKPYKTLTPGNWVVVGSGVYSTTDTVAKCCLWEDDKWLNHPNGANYAAVSAALASTPGSFWTDGTTLYLHPFGNTDPRSDGKTYTRSQCGFAFPVVQLAEKSINLQGLYMRKACDVDPANGTPNGGYLIGSAGGYGGTTLIKNCYLDYGGKHNFGLVDNASNTDVTIDNVQSEQAAPVEYANYGGQSPFVSFMDTGTGNIHRYIRCKTLRMAGAIGSTAGNPGSTGAVFLTHGGAGVFSEVQIIDCSFSKALLLDYGSANLITIRGTTFGYYESNAPNLNLSRCVIDFWAVTIDQPGYVFTMRNCLLTPSSGLQAGQFVGFDIQGTVEMSNNVFDLLGIPWGEVDRGIVNRKAALNLTFRNNVVIVPSGWNYTVLYGGVNTDTLSFTKNAYTLGALLQVAGQYNDGTTTANRTLAQWQALGKDAGSFNSNALKLTGYKPAADSPVVNAGVNLGPLEDYSGKVFNPRDDIGAYEFAAASTGGGMEAGSGIYGLLYQIALNTGTPPKVGEGIHALAFRIAQNTAGTPPKVGDGLYDLFYKIAKNTAGTSPVVGESLHSLLYRIAGNTAGIKPSVGAGRHNLLSLICENTG